MYHADLSQRIAQEQREKMVAAVESAAVTLFGVVTGALLPQMLYQYLLENSADQLFAPPAFIQYIPHVGYAVAAGFFVSALVGNFMRSRRIRAYQQELQMVSYLDGCEDCLPEANSSASEKAKPATKTARSSRSKSTTAKKTTRKTTKKASSK